MAEESRQEKEELTALEQKIVEEFGQKIEHQGRSQDGFLYLQLKPEDLLDVCRRLKENEDYAFRTLHCISAVDYPKEGEIEVVYHLYSMDRKTWLVLKVRVPREKPEVPSLCKIWPGANWLEREQYDLLGVIFLNHPDHRRILLPDYWPGFPLRKDWVEPDYKELTRLAIEGAFDT